MNIKLYRLVTTFINLLLTALLLVAPLAAAESDSEGETAVQYLEMRPAFVLNFGGPAKKMKFAKVDISLRVNSSSAGESVKSHMPALRNEVVLLLSRQGDEAMGSTAGRETLRSEALERLNSVLREETGSEAIDELLFTTFVVQR